MSQPKVTKKKGEVLNKEQPIVIQQISIRPWNRQSADLGNYRNYTKAAEATVPRRKLLYELFYDLITTDAHIISVWGKRVDAITCSDWQFTDKNGNPVDEINHLIDSIGFESMLTDMMSSKAWGYAMGEATFFRNDNDQLEVNYFEIPKKHMRPEIGFVAKEELGDEGINIREGIYSRTVMEFGNPKSLGLLLSAAQYAILKRGDISDWAEFIEIFGRGIIDATWDGFDEKARIQLNESLTAMGSGGIIIRPAGTTIDVKNNTGNANGDLQEKFMIAMNKEISKALLGSTETTESSKSSGYAQSQTHQQQDENKIESDINYIRRNLNSKFIKVMKAFGIDTKGGSFVLKSERELEKKDAFALHLSMARDLGLPFSDDFFYEEYGMPKPADYDAQKAEKEAATQQIQQSLQNKNDNTPPASNNKKDKKPVNMSDDERTFWGRLTSFFVQAPAQIGAMENNLKLTDCCGNLRTNWIEFADLGDKGEDDLINRFWDSKGKRNFDPGLFNFTAEKLLKGFYGGWKSRPTNLIDLGFMYGVDDPALLTAFETNIFRFAGVKTLYEARQLNDLYKRSGSFNEFYSAAKKLVKVHNRDWLRTEYDTAYAVGEATATYQRLIKQTDLFPFWQYKTIGDNLVRDSHRILEGLILPANHPYWDIIFPPNGWNCRCYILPRTAADVEGIDHAAMIAQAKDYFGSIEFKKSAKAGFGINRAKTELVFSENQNYITNQLDANKKLEDFLPSDYGLKDLEQAAISNEKFSPFTGKANDFFKDNSNGGILSLTDYHNRPIVMPKKDFNSQSKDNTLLLSEVPTLLLKPDEVWLRSKDRISDATNSDFNRFVYVKYYEGKVIAAIVENKNGEMILQKWFEILKDLFRFGLLIKS